MDNIEELMLKAQHFATTLTEGLNKQYIDTILDTLSAENAETADVLKGGFALGAASAYETIMPRALEMGAILKSTYEKIGEMIDKHDNIEFLSDLASVRGEIAGYIASEGEQILKAVRVQISETSGVPAQYLDESILISDIPSSVLAEIGQRAAAANIRMFAIFAVSGSKSTKDGKTLTMEELVELAQKGQIKLTTDLKGAEFNTLLPSYGSAVVRRARAAYQQISGRIDKYKSNQDTDAKTIADSLMGRIREGAKP